MRSLDIREYKRDIREQGRLLRERLAPDDRRKMDEKIAKNVRRLYQYGPCKTLMIYVSTPIEVSTREIITAALAEGKRVAVPRCRDGTRDMDFYYINSLSELKAGTFGVLEPQSDAEPLLDFTGCLMIVPGIQFDNNGYRIGYGKGYYDRYMSRYTGYSAGLCYDWELRRHLAHGRFDRAVNAVVTDSRIRSCKKV